MWSYLNTFFCPFKLTKWAYHDILEVKTICQSTLAASSGSWALKLAACIKGLYVALSRFNCAPPLPGG